MSIYKGDKDSEEEYDTMKIYSLKNKSVVEEGFYMTPCDRCNIEAYQLVKGDNKEDEGENKGMAISKRMIIVIEKWGAK
jgi:hypothetical protein